MIIIEGFHSGIEALNLAGVWRGGSRWAAHWPEESNFVQKNVNIILQAVSLRLA